MVHTCNQKLESCDIGKEQIIMDERLYKKVKSVGVSNLVFGILIMLFGIGSGIMMIVNGARLLAHKSDTLF